MNPGDLLVLLELRNHDTFSAAARALDVSHTTVSRKVKDLEAYFGARLVERLGEKINLTAEGESAASAAEAILQQINLLERRIDGRDSSLFGNIAVTTVDVLAWHFMERLKLFTHRYPAIQLTVSAETAVRSLSRREAEVALRLTNDPEPYLYGKVIDRFDFARYTSITGTASDDVVWLDYTGQECSARSAEWMRQNLPGVVARAYFSSPLMLLRAVEAGLGEGLLPVQVAERSSMVRRVGEDVAFSLDIWLLAPKELRSTARIRALFASLSDVA